MKQITPAMEVAKYWGHCAAEALDKIAFDRRSKAEEVVMTVAKRICVDGQHATRRDFRRAINYKTMSSDELNKTIEALWNAQELVYDAEVQTFFVSPDLM